jgi:ppGpp synthetase/RelA/SpoT-type nucleotidyltranferase
MTSSPESVRRAYDASWPIIESVQKYVSKTLKAFCGERYIFRDRIKSLASLSEKLETGRFGKWSELDDLYACTIVVSIASSEQQVLEYLRSAFVEIRVRGRSDTKKDPGVFRFDGLRWYGKIRPEVADQMLPGVASFIFEVQVLTAFEYAWSQVNHSLVYKADEVDWKRERLSAQLKSAVEQIEMIIASFDATSSLVPESPWPAYDSMKLIISKFKQWMIAGKISETRLWNQRAGNDLLRISMAS